MLGVLKDPFLVRPLYIFVGVLDVVVEDTPGLSPHQPPKLKPKVLFNLLEETCPNDHISIQIQTICLGQCLK